MSAAFAKAERSRRGSGPRRAATFAQRDYLADLAKRAGVTTPHVRWADEATRSITDLEHRLTQPTLDGLA